MRGRAWAPGLMTVPAPVCVERLLVRLARAELGEQGLGVSSAEMGKLRALAAGQSEIGAGKFSDGLRECFYPWNNCCWRIGEAPFCTNWPCNTFKTFVFSSHARGLSAKQILLPRRVSRLRG